MKKQLFLFMGLWWTSLEGGAFPYCPSNIFWKQWNSRSVDAICDKNPQELKRNLRSGALSLQMLWIAYDLATGDKELKSLLKEALEKADPSVNAPSDVRNIFVSPETAPPPGAAHISNSFWWPVMMAINLTRNLPSRFEKLREIAPHLQTVEKKLLNTAGGNATWGRGNREIVWSCLLFLKHLNVSQARAQLHFLKTQYPAPFAEFNDSFFELNLTRLAESFPVSASKDWAGHIVVPSAQDAPEVAAPRPTFTEQRTKFSIISKDDIELALWKTAKTPPDSIVLWVYTGCSQATPCGLTPPYFFLNSSKNIWSASLSLMDKTSPIHQSNQLTPPHFKNTHMLYLGTVSEMVRFLKHLYPDAKIFLAGASFGGFFVASYGFLQSLQYDPSISLDTIYQPWVAQELKQFKKPLSAVAGVLSFSGALDRFTGLLLKPDVLRQWKVPLFVAQSFDDNRVYIGRTSDPLQNLEKYASPWLVYDLVRQGALPYGGDIQEAGPSTTRGHFIASKPGASDLDDNHKLAAASLFIQNVLEGKPLDSPLKKEMARVRLTQTHPLFPPLFQQFLSNVRQVQQQLLQKKIAPENVISESLRHIDLPKLLALFGPVAFDAPFHNEELYTFRRALHNLAANYAATQKEPLLRFPKLTSFQERFLKFLVLNLFKAFMADKQVTPHLYEGYTFAENRKTLEENLPRFLNVADHFHVEGSSLSADVAMLQGEEKYKKALVFMEKVVYKTLQQLNSTKGRWEALVHMVTPPAPAPGEKPSPAENL